MRKTSLSVRAKLAITFGLLVGLVMMISLLAMRNMTLSHERFFGFVNGVNLRAQLSARVRNAVDQRSVAVRNFVLVTKSEDMQFEKASAIQADLDVQSWLKKLDDAVGPQSDATDEARVLVRQIDRIEARYRPVALAIVKAAADGQRDKAVTLIDEQCRPLLTELIKATDAYEDYTLHRASVLVSESADSYARARMLMILLCAISVLGAIVAGALITRDITRALGTEPSDLSEITRRVAAGDLAEIASSKDAPVGSVLASMGEMQSNLANLIGQVRAAVQNIAVSSHEIASGNLDLSARTERQAASLEETASSMEELTSTVRQNADSAKQASAVATNTSSIASKGREEVGQVIEAMTTISQRSSEIAEITGLIEGIAFQTNILALNAAVEAARAAEHGQGFAVVATEVRNLAQRSSSAAKQIKLLITNSTQDIEEGFRRASSAGKTMEAITEAVAKVNDLIADVAAASDEQSRGIDQINATVSQMDEVTQHNAALVEETTAASRSLKEQGDQLTRAVAVFQLDPMPPSIGAEQGALVKSIGRRLAVPRSAAYGLS